MGLAVVALVLALQQPIGSPASASGKPSYVTAQSPSNQPLKPDDLPVSLDRIQRALSTPAAIQLKEQHPVFRLEVFGKKPTLEDVLGEKFWLGPTPYGGMTHQEFMNMV